MNDSQIIHELFLLICGKFMVICVLISKELYRKSNKMLRRTKKVVFSQRQSEEFAERMTTFMAFTVVPSLNINEPSLSRGGFVFWVGFRWNGDAILNKFLCGTLKPNREFYFAMSQHNQFLKLQNFWFIRGQLVFSKAIFIRFSENVYFSKRKMYLDEQIPNTNACIRAFGRRFQLPTKEAFKYLLRFKGVAFLVDF